MEKYIPIIGFKAVIDDSSINAIAELDMVSLAVINITAHISEKELKEIYQPALNAFKHCTQELIKKIDQ